MKKRNTPVNKLYFIALPVTAIAVYILRLFSGFNNASGTSNIGYTDMFPVILFLGFALVTLLMFPYIIKCKKEEELLLHIIPLMLFAALGMMKIDSSEAITSRHADYSSAIMLLIFLLSLVATAFYTPAVTGAVFTVAGTLIYPAFALTFAPFITASSFIHKYKSTKEKKISVTVNLSVSLIGAVFAVIKLTVKEDISFRKELIPVLLMVSVCSVFLAVIKKEKLIPFALLPLFPMISDIVFGIFPTIIVSLSSCVSPMVLFVGNAILTSDSKEIKGFAEKLLKNPLAYIAIAYFILLTAFSMFSIPGVFRHAYV